MPECGSECTADRRSPRHRFGLTRLLLLLLVGSGLLLPALGAVGSGPPGARTLVDAAEAAFEQGEIAWLAGDHALARVLFDRSLLLLQDAEALDAGKEPRRYVELRSRYRAERARYDESPRTDGVEAAARHRQGDSALSDSQIAAHLDIMATRHRRFVERAFARALPYIPMIREEFRRAGIPPALAYMALIESGFHESAQSPCGARGIWQFMPATARRFGLVVSDENDERLDPVLSTRAAARYLTFLHSLFGDWPLAVAAYNCGEGRVRTAVRRSGARTFWELAERGALPQESREYVPRIVAVTLIARDPERHGFRGPGPDPATTR